MANAQTTATRQFRTSIDIPDDKREPLVAILNQSLANTFDLASQTKQAHWNVKGKDFYQLHLLFDEIAGELFSYVDEIAERLTALGGYANGTVRMASEYSTLPEYPVKATEGGEHVAALVERFAKYAAQVRAMIAESDDLNDPSTADLFTQISRTVDKRLWFLEAHLQK